MNDCAALTRVLGDGQAVVGGCGHVRCIQIELHPFSMPDKSRPPVKRNRPLTRRDHQERNITILCPPNHLPQKCRPDALVAIEWRGVDIGHIAIVRHSTVWPRDGMEEMHKDVGDKDIFLL
jgi:hypothetical protein